MTWSVFIHFSQVTDRREVHFEDKREHVFKGVGQTLGGETKPSRLVPTKLEDKTTDTEEPANPDVETTSQLPGKNTDSKIHL